MRKLLLMLLILLATISYSQTTSFYIKPVKTDPKYSVKDDSNYIVINQKLHLNKLVLFIGGTGSSPNNNSVFCNYSASLGFDAISVCYPNSVSAIDVADNTDSLAFNKYRQEICFGTPVSSYVSVDSLNSIYTRTIKLIQYLARTYPKQNWKQYLASSDKLNWSKIIVAGHSQGSGHACYFGKIYKVDRVLMLSGPNDYSAYFKKSANWLRKPGVTPVNKQFALLHLNDEIVPFSRQYINLKGIGMHKKYDSTLVDNKISPYSNSHFLYTKIKAKLNHNLPVSDYPKMKEVWKYMLTSSVAEKKSK